MLQVWSLLMLNTSLWLTGPPLSTHQKRGQSHSSSVSLFFFILLEILQVFCVWSVRKIVVGKFAKHFTFWCSSLNLFCRGLWKLTDQVLFNNQNVYSGDLPLSPGLREVSEYLNISPFAGISSEYLKIRRIHRGHPPRPPRKWTKTDQIPSFHSGKESIRELSYTSLLIISFTARNFLIQKVGLQLHELV